MGSNMKDYSKMSDFELNKLVHFCRLKSGDIKERYRLNDVDFVDVFRNSFSDDGDDAVIAVMRYVKDGKSDGYNPFGSACDYCNNPSDAWPVILENRISLRPDDMYEEAPHGGYWRADNEAGNHCHHENPFRSAMIVYLMMKDEEK